MATKIKSIWNYISSHKLIFSIILIIIIIIIFTLLLIKLSFNFTVLTINEDKYSKADMNMILYNLKYDYYGKDASDITNATLDEYIESVNMSASEYLKQEATKELKYRSAIKQIAKDNNIVLSKEDESSVDEDITKIIESFGSHGKFKNFLRKNGITKKAYRNYLESNKLYEVVFNNLYTKGKENYLTTEQITEETKNYYNTYYKIEQIVLALVDPNTLEDLTDTVKNQKEILIKAIEKEVAKGTNFNELVKKYSEEAKEDNELYFTKGEVLDEIYEAVDKLKVNRTSSIIKTKYAYSIVKRLELDDKKLDEFLEKKAKEKFNNDIIKKAEDYKAFYENAYKKIK